MKKIVLLLLLTSKFYCMALADENLTSMINDPGFESSSLSSWTVQTGVFGSDNISPEISTSTRATVATDAIVIMDCDGNNAPGFGSGNDGGYFDITTDVSVASNCLNTTTKCAHNTTSSGNWYNRGKIWFDAISVTDSRRYLHIMVFTPADATQNSAMIVLKPNATGGDQFNDLNGATSGTDWRFNIPKGVWTDKVWDLQTKGITVFSEIYFADQEWTDGTSNRNYFYDEIVLNDDPNPRTADCGGSTPFTGTQITIDAATTYQTIEGFGASDCWMGNFVGKWSGNNKATVAKWLFSQDFDNNGNPEGIGLSIWRFNLGAGTYELGDATNNVGMNVDSRVARRAECFLANVNTAGTYNWDKCAGQRYFLQQAKDYGCESFVAFSNSPVLPFTKNNQGYSGSNTAANINTSGGYAGFADYIVDVVKHFRDDGYNFNYISPINEPQWGWTSQAQEGSPYTNAEIKNLVTALDNSISTKGLTGAEIMISEAGKWSFLYENTSVGSGDNSNAGSQIDAFFNSSNTNYVGNLASVAPAISGHSYWLDKSNSNIKSVRESVKSAAVARNLKVHQTEWSMMEATGVDGFPSSWSYIDVALNMAKIIHSDMAYADAVSWSYWTAMYMEQWSQKNRFMLVKLGSGESYPNNYTDLETEMAVEAEPNLWSLGNYSFFVRPGYKRIGLAGAADLGGLMGTAYIAPDNSKIVAVYVNIASESKTLRTAFSNLGSYTPTTNKMYVTSSSSSLGKYGDASSETYTEDRELIIPARSVATVVYELQAPADFIVNSSKNSSDYLAGNYSDIIFEDDGQLTINETNIDGGLKPSGVVKVKKTFAKDTWYALGFPFNIVSVNCAEYDGGRALETFKLNGSNGDFGDYWLKTYNGAGDTFDDYTSGASSIAAGGYVLQVPEALDNVTFTFTSESDAVLSNASTFSTLSGGYKLTSNPSVANLEINNAASDYFYAFSTPVFGKIAAPYTLKPFESTVIASGITGALRSMLNIETATSLQAAAADQIVATEYYNLQGMRISSSDKGLQLLVPGIYIVKKVYASGKISVSKSINK